MQTGQRSGGDHGTADKAFSLTKRAFILSEWRTLLSAWQRCLALGLVAVFATLALATAASAETRSLKLYFVHTREKAEITYKKNGRYLKGGLTKINRFLRDWRRNEPTKMDPRLLDLIWEVYRKSGSRKHIHVISAYRSPATNAMLRKRGRGVANKSQHMLGKAMDFYLPDVKLSKLRKISLQMQSGGVGYYPRSGSPFVHLDVGSVRHWPRMNRRELVAMFPNGRTLHVPSDGKPLPGYKQALASYNKRKKSGGGVVIASAAPDKPEKRNSGGLLAAFFNGGQDDEEDSVQAATAPKAVKTIPAPVDVKKEPQTPEMIIAALPAREVPLPLFAPRPKADVGEAAEEPVEPVEAAPLIETPAETAETETLVALNVPRPTPRPEVPSDADLAIRIAAAAGNPAPAAISDRKAGLEVALALMSSERPPSANATGKGDRVVAVPLPEARPREASTPVVVAALPDNGPTFDAGPARFGVPVLRETAVAEKSSRVELPQDEKAAGRKAAASPRELILASVEVIDPEAAVATGIRTTEKSGKPVAADRPPARQVMVVPLPESLSRRAFTKTHIARARGSSRAPSFAFDVVGRAPREVYTAGFSRTDRIVNPYRFTGKAVHFLSVARFN